LWSYSTTPDIAAHGTDFAPGGLAVVGERGPEIVNLPRGSQVIPNHRIGMVANQNSAPANIHVTFGTSVDNNGNILPFVESVTQKNISRAVPRIVGAAVTEAGRRVVPSLAKHQTQKAGGDWRNGG
jgi:phage-related tail protein